MGTIIKLGSEILIKTEENIPLNVGEVFTYICHPSILQYIEENHDVESRRIKSAPYSSEKTISVLIESLNRQTDLKKQHFEKWNGRDVKFIVTEKQNFITNNNGLSFDFNSYIKVDIMDEAFIRNEKLKELI